MEYKEENNLKTLVISILVYAVICLIISQYPSMDLDTYFKLRYGH